MKKIFFTISCFVVLSILTFSGCDKNDSCSSEPNLLVSQDQPALDIAAIDAYLSKNGISSQTDETGIRYVVNKEGTGGQADLCSIATVIYQGKLMSNGAIFDTRSTPISFPLRNLIVGWQIGIPKVRAGGTITLYLPSVYAYGAFAKENIPANSNLIFEITLLGIN